MQSNLNDPKFTTIIFAVIVKKLGGSVTITQADIDEVAYNRLEEKGNMDGSLEFRLIERQRSA
jgi:hypothetical protein